MEKKREPSMSIKFIDVNRPGALEDSFYVRREVFIKEQNVPEEEEFGRIGPEGAPCDCVCKCQTGCHGETCSKWKKLPNWKDLCLE